MLDYIQNQDLEADNLKECIEWVDNYAKSQRMFYPLVIKIPRHH